MADSHPIIVTGASRGVGLELTGQLLASGKSVIAVARHAPDLPDTEALRFITCDLCDIDAVAGLSEELRSYEPGGLINNAAVQTQADWTAMPPQDLANLLRREIDLDLIAPMMLSFGLIGAIAKAPQGFVCNVNSALALAPKMTAPAYCAAKAGLSNATLALRGCARDWPHVLVSEVFLPLVDTEMTAGRGSGKIPAKAAAAAILRGLHRRRAETWVGRTRLLWLLWRLSPARTRRLLLGTDAPGQALPGAGP
jgi:uncharacterized oxidoreductase